MQMVHSSTKRAFLKQFLSDYSLKNREVKQLFLHLIQEPDVLEQIHFVENFRSHPSFFTASASNSPYTAAFRYHRANHGLTEQVDVLFQDLYIYRQEVYVGLFFKNKMHYSPYFSVLEDLNESFVEPCLQSYYAQEAERIIKDSLHFYEQERVSKAIDQALDARNEFAFHIACEARKNLIDSIEKSRC